MPKDKLTKEEFVLQAITNLRKDPYKGIHAVYSGFNQAFKEYFGEDARATVDRMIAEDKIEFRMVKGGPMIYLDGEMPERAGSDALDKIIGGS